MSTCRSKGPDEVGVEHMHDYLAACKGPKYPRIKQPEEGPKHPRGQKSNGRSKGVGQMTSKMEKEVSWVSSQERRTVGEKKGVGSC